MDEQRRAAWNALIRKSRRREPVTPEERHALIWRRLPLAQCPLPAVGNRFTVSVRSWVMRTDYGFRHRPVAAQDDIRRNLIRQRPGRLRLQRRPKRAPSPTGSNGPGSPGRLVSPPRAPKSSKALGRRCQSPDSASLMRTEPGIPRFYLNYLPSIFKRDVVL